MKAAPLSLLASVAVVSLALGTSGCVDETGYECPDGTFVETQDLCVDETGYLVPDLVAYTAPAPLDHVPRDVTLLGRPGALPGAGTLVVEGASGPAVVVGPDDEGAFRAVLEAALGDVVTVRFSPADGEEGVDSLTLDDPLDGVPAPTTSSAPLLSPSDDAGLVTVFLSGLSAPPFLVYNDDAAEPALVFSDVSEDVTLPGAAGDIICVFHVRPDEDAQSTPLCQAVPTA